MKQEQIQKIREEIKKAYILDDIIHYLYKEFCKENDTKIKQKLINQLEKRRIEYEKTLKTLEQLKSNVNWAIDEIKSIYNWLIDQDGRIQNNKLEIMKILERLESLEEKSKGKRWFHKLRK